MASVNDLSFNQLATVLASIVGQATGSAVLAPLTTGDFISVGSTALKQGYDPVLGAISQVLSRTIFSVRPYERKFKGLQATTQQFGNITRKLQTADKALEDDSRLSLVDGTSIDPYVVNKPTVLQTNFYGAETYQKSMTLFKDQLDCAFNGPDEFQRFVAMVMTNAMDQLEQAREDVARACIANFIGGKKVADNGVVHLLTEYNAKTGLSLTATTLYTPTNFKPFMQWVYSRIAALSSMLTERSTLYHINITGKAISRHTPYAAQRLFLFAPMMFQSTAQVLADTFHDNYLSMSVKETVNFWQSIITPDSVNVKPTYLGTDGALVTPAAASTIANVFGVLLDEEAAGYTLVNQWSAPTPFNPKGGYSNMFWHETSRYWNDFTENGILLLLD